MLPTLSSVLPTLSPVCFLLELSSNFLRGCQVSPDVEQQYQYTEPTKCINPACQNTRDWELDMQASLLCCVPFVHGSGSLIKAKPTGPADMTTYVGFEVEPAGKVFDTGCVCHHVCVLSVSCPPEETD